MVGKKALILVILFAAMGLLALEGTSFSGFFTAQDSNSIKIGFVGPLSGDAAIYGTVEKNAIEIAKDEINANGGINGKKLEVIYEDGKCNGKDSVTAAQKLIELDKIKIILPDCSAATLAMAPLTEQNKVLQLAAWSTNPQVTFAGDYVFRNSYSDEDIAKTAAQTIYKESKSVAVIYENNAFSVGIKDAFVKHFNNFGGTVFEEGFPENSRDVRTQVMKLLEKNPEAVFVDANTPSTTLAVLNQLEELGYSGKLYGNLVAGSTQVVESSQANGVVFFADPVVENNSIKQKLFEEYKKRYGVSPEFEYPVASRYDSVYILAQAIENVGYDSTKIRDYLYSMPNYSGALGSYSFDSNGDVVGITPSIKQIKNGKVLKYF